MNTAVFIADIVLIAKPASSKSRLHQVTIRKSGFPLVLDVDTHEIAYRDMKYRRILKGHIDMSNYEKYRVTMDISNVKFSTNHNYGQEGSDKNK